MATWTTGYLEFHEEPFIGASTLPTEISILCPYCQNTFSDEDSLSKHRFEAHPTRRPSLFICGKELASKRFLVTKPILEPDVKAANCSAAKVNGESISLGLFPKFICSCQLGLKKVCLTNKEVEAEFRIEFDIPKSEEIDEIDRLFVLQLSEGQLDIGRINRFIEATKPYHTAVRYADGLVQYLYGVLAKDSRGGIHVPQRQYKEKYNLAMETLQNYDTLLAAVIIGLINLESNVFGGFERVKVAPDLMHCLMFFHHALQKKEPRDLPKAVSAISSTNRVPLDDWTHQIICWSLMSSARFQKDEQYLLEEMDDPLVELGDRLKLKILLVEKASIRYGLDRIRDIVRPLRGDPFLGPWAERHFQGARKVST